MLQLTEVEVEAPPTFEFSIAHLRLPDDPFCKPNTTIMRFLSLCIIYGA